MKKKKRRKKKEKEGEATMDKGKIIKKEKEIKKKIKQKEKNKEKKKQKTLTEAISSADPTSIGVAPSVDATLSNSFDISLFPLVFNGVFVGDISLFPLFLRFSNGKN